MTKLVKLIVGVLIGGVIAVGAFVFKSSPAGDEVAGADSSISGLTALTTPGSTDLFVIVDNSGTATTKKITYANATAPLLYLTGGTLTGALIGTRASLSNDLEVVGYASASKYFGATLTDCDAATTSKLLWSNTGLFSCGTDSFDATAQDALTWSDGVNASNLWTFDLSGTDPTLLFRTGGFTFTGTATISSDFEVGGLASASLYYGSAFGAIDCNDAADQLLYSAGIFTCEALADADIPDAISVIGGIIGANSISGTQTTTGTTTFGDGGDVIDFATSTWDIASGVFTGGTLSTFNVTGTWTTTGNLTIGDNGDDVIIDSDTWDVSSLGVASGLTGLTSTGDVDLGGAELEISNGTGMTFDTIGEIYFDTTDFQVQIASAAANSPRVLTTMPLIWSASIPSNSSQFSSGGRYYLPIRRDKYNISEIRCDVTEGTSVVINLSNRAGTYDSETVTCDADGAADTSIDTNSNYSGTSVMSGSLEFGTITGNVEWLNFSIYGLPAAQ